MTTGVITSIVHDGTNLLISTTIAGAVYSINMSPEYFDSLDTAGKISFLTAFLTAQRTINRLPENVHQELIGTVLTLPTLPE